MPEVMIFCHLISIRQMRDVFKIIDGKLMPALSTIEGLGEKAADAVMDAAKEGKFLSKDDFRDRTKVSKTVIDLMDDLGILAICQRATSCRCLTW